MLLSEIIIIAFGLALDAFAVSLVAGLSEKSETIGVLFV
jgi:putative Mn2+ efflux pump MntP